MVPQEGGLVTVHNYVPSNQDVVYKYNQASGGYDTPRTWIQTTGPGVGFWTGGGEPIIGVGEAFWIKATAAQTWTRDFTVPRE
jgi:hypothetical protein